MTKITLEEFKAKFLYEDGALGGAPLNSAGGGGIASVGVNNPNIPNQAEPGVDNRKKNKKRKSPIMMQIQRRKRPN